MRKNTKRYNSLSDSLVGQIELFSGTVVPVEMLDLKKKISKKNFLDLRVTIIGCIMEFCVKAQQSKRHDLYRYLNKLSYSKKYKNNGDIIRDMANEIESQVE